MVILMICLTIVRQCWVIHHFLVKYEQQYFSQQNYKNDCHKTKTSTKTKITTRQVYENCHDLMSVGSKHDGFVPFGSLQSAHTNTCNSTMSSSSSAPNHYLHKIACESIVFLCSGKAALLQLAHPYIAIGIMQHSKLSLTKTPHINDTTKFTFPHSKSTTPTQRGSKIILPPTPKTPRWYKMKHKNVERNGGNGGAGVNYSAIMKTRFHNTFSMLFPILYGPQIDAIKQTKLLIKIHNKIKGVIDEPIIVFSTKDSKGDAVGLNGKDCKNGNIRGRIRKVEASQSIKYRVGSEYTANDMMASKWVAATLFESMIFSYLLIFGEKSLNKNMLNMIYIKSKEYQGLPYGLSINIWEKDYDSFMNDYYKNIIIGNIFNGKMDDLAITNEFMSLANSMNETKKWWHKPISYIIRIVTNIIMPQTVLNKIKMYDEYLASLDEEKEKEKNDKFLQLRYKHLYSVTKFDYLIGLLFLSIIKILYPLIPKYFRVLNGYSQMYRRHWTDCIEKKIKNLKTIKKKDFIGKQNKKSNMINIKIMIEKIKIDANIWYNKLLIWFVNIFGQKLEFYKEKMAKQMVSLALGAE